jgi:hypothetical protein
MNLEFKTVAKYKQMGYGRLRAKMSKARWPVTYIQNKLTEMQFHYFRMRIRNRTSTFKKEKENQRRCSTVKD